MLHPLCNIEQSEWLLKPAGKLLIDKMYSSTLTSPETRSSLQDVALGQNILVLVTSTSVQFSLRNQYDILLIDCVEGNPIKNPGTVHFVKQSDMLAQAHQQSSDNPFEALSLPVLKSWWIAAKGEKSWKQNYLLNMPM